MKKISLVSLLVVMSFYFCTAQKDMIYKKDSTQVRCKILKFKSGHYQYVFVDSFGKVIKAKVPKVFVDSVAYNVYNNNLVQSKIFANETKQAAEEPVLLQKNWKFLLSLGLNLESILVFNNPFGSDKKSLSATSAIDAGLNYSKEGSRFSMTNEAHYIFGLQKPGFTSTDHLQRVTDQLNFLQDISIAMGKNKKWNFNVIAKAAVNFFTIYNGEYFKDYTSLGKIQSFLSPYDVTISPGIKWQPDKYLRISISPYSFNLYGVTNPSIAAKGIYITDMDAAGNYKKNLFKRLGAELNVWYDRQVKKWLDIQYRLGVSSDYFEKIGKNGLMNGLFITRLKIIKDLYVTHRLELKNNLAGNLLKPYFNQSILLSYTKSF